MGNTQGKPVSCNDAGRFTGLEPGWTVSGLPEPPRIILNNMLIAFPLPVNLNHFRLLRVVGKGAFGKVRIVERKDTGLTFALKYIRKEEGVLELQSHHIERAIADTRYSGTFGKCTEYNS